MICVPYIVNGNYKVARLSAAKSPNPCYIIEKEQGNNEVRLFKFEQLPIAFNPAQGTGARGANDFIFVPNSEGSSVTIDAANHTADITLALSMKHIQRDKNGNIIMPRQNFAPKDGLSIKEHEVYYDIRDINERFDDIMIINVRFFEPVQELYYDFSVNVAPREKTYDIVIDFGSEASQIWINRRDNDPANDGNMMSLFTNIKDASVYKDNENTKIYQFDATNENLYRSLFFVKNAINAAKVRQDDITFINLEDKLETILSDNVALPNMKLMDHNNVPLPTIRVNRHAINIYQYANNIRAEILKFFFKTALNVIDDTNDTDVACKITFLVPNTYKQDTLSSVHNELINDLRQLREEASNPFAHIKGDIEVATFSESDASFFGWYRAGDYTLNDANKRMLIIDVGKGTTDFSVLRIANDNGLVGVERMARSGFVGAGNVMTFALLASIIRQIAYKKDETQVAQIYDAVRAMAYHTDRAKKNKLYRELETLKCAQHINGRQTIAQFINNYDFSALRSISDLNIEKLSEILEQANGIQCFQQDDDVVVCAYAKQITDLLIHELRYVYDEDVHVDRVVLSGRGAKSQPLVNAIKAAFRRINKNVDFIQLPNEVTKSGCLKGPLNVALHLDHMNMNVVGWPQQKRNPAIRLENHVESQPAKDDDKKEQGGVMARIRRISKIIFNPDEQVKHNEQAKASNGFAQDAIAREFLRGISPEVQSERLEHAQRTQYTIAADTNLFVIGNRRCMADLAGANAQLGSKKMYFDGNDFVLRDTNHSVKFVYDLTAQDEGFLTETFFPMTELNGANIVNMPQLNQVLTDCSTVEDAEEIDDGVTRVETQPATGTLTTGTKPTLTTSTSDDDDDDFAVDE